MGAVKIQPQEGPQTEFLSTTADIALYGGAAGGGKSFALLLEPLRHYNNSKFGGVIFRRNATAIRLEGGLWDDSLSVYLPLKGHPREQFLSWNFPSGMSLRFAHLELERTVYDWQGGQIPYIGFDELTHFTEKQFWYMLSRNRSTSGVAGYIRATCNPDADSWVRKLVDWYIGEDGYPIKERSGIIRWFIRRDDAIIWADKKEELLEKYGEDCGPKSFTFISALVTDNKILMEKDPAYLHNLKALAKVERLRLLGGNWNIRPTAGLYFQREWFEIIDELKMSNAISSSIRYWDRAATKPSENNKDPDWSVGVRMHRMVDGTFVVSHVSRFRETPLKVEQTVKNLAVQDGVLTKVGIEQEPGAAGVADADNYVRLLAGYQVKVCKPTTDKITRALPVSAQCERGNVKLVRGDWNEEFLRELENFPPEASQSIKKRDEESFGHDDQVDAFSGAFNELCGDVSLFDHV